MTYKEFLLLSSVMDEQELERLLERLNNSRKPRFFCDKEVPKDLFGLSYGDLEDLQGSLHTGEDPAVACLKCVLGVSEAEVYDAPVSYVYGVMIFVTKEIEKINKLFESIKPKYTDEELRAGVQNLHYGTFGVLDWYARRMGIGNQNDVRDVAWVRIFNCMKMDNEKDAYERRLHKEYARNNGRK